MSPILTTGSQMEHDQPVDQPGSGKTRKASKTTTTTPVQLRRWRTRAGINRQFLADVMLVSPNTIARWETGKTPIPPHAQATIRFLFR